MIAHAEHLAASAAALAGETDLGARLRGTVRALIDVSAPYHAFAATFYKYAAEPSSPLSPFSKESSPTRDASIALYREVVDGSSARMSREVRERLPELLWLYSMGVVLYWVHDTSAGLRADRPPDRRHRAGRRAAGRGHPDPDAALDGGRHRPAHRRPACLTAAAAARPACQQPDRMPLGAEQLGLSGRELRVAQGALLVQAGEPAELIGHRRARVAAPVRAVPAGSAGRPGPARPGPAPTRPGAGPGSCPPCRPCRRPRPRAAAGGAARTSQAPSGSDSPSATMISGAAATTLGAPTCGAMARSTPRISLGAAPASRAADTCHR